MLPVSHYGSSAYTSAPSHPKLMKGELSEQASGHLKNKALV